MASTEVVNAYLIKNSKGEGGGGGGGWRRWREKENSNSNSKTLFYKDCSSGSVKNLSNN